MFKPLTALTLSATLALTSITATPAQADSEEVARILGGLALLYVLKEAAEDRGNHRQRVTHTPPREVQRPHRGKIIPGKCFRQVTARNGRTVKGFGAKCMQNNVRRAGALPPNCLRKVRTDRGQRFLYKPKCLRNNGWLRG